MLPASIRSRFLTLTEPLEGRERSGYRDVRGLFTVGLGCLIPSLSVSLSLPWREPGTGALAAPSGIARDWARIMALPPALTAAHYRSETGLHLDDGAIDALATTRLEADARILAGYWPGWDGMPEGARLALLSLAWAVGAGATAHGLTGPEWPLLQAAVQARDWEGAEREGRISEAGNLGVVRRNAVNRDLFMEASRESR